MNLGRVAGVNVFRKVRQFETLLRPGGLLARGCNPIEFPRSTSSLANLNRAISHAKTYPKCCILSKPIAQSTTSLSQTRAAATVHGDHVRLWIIERIVSASFLILIPSSILFESKFIDMLLTTAVVMHMHWGLEAIVLDYVRPIVVGTVIPKVAFLAVYLLSALTFAGLLVLIYNGPGLSQIIKQGWAIGKDKKREKEQ